MLFETILPSYFIPADNFEHLKFLPPLEFNISFDNSSKFNSYTEIPHFSKTLAAVFNWASDAGSYTSNASNSLFCPHQKDIHSPTLCKQENLPSLVFSSVQTDTRPPLVSSSTQTDCVNSTQWEVIQTSSLVCSSAKTACSNRQDVIPSPQLVSSLTQTDKLSSSSEENNDEVLQPLDISETFQPLKEAVKVQDGRLDLMDQHLKSLADMLRQATKLILQYSQCNTHVPTVDLADNTGHSEHPFGQAQCVNKTEQSPYQELPSRSSLSGVELQSLSQVIPKFSGDKEKFQSFKYKFKTIVDSMKLSGADKALLLFVSLEDSVLDLIGDIKSGECIDYQKLWFALEEEFAPLQQGLFSHIAKLYTIKYMPQCNNSKKLKELHRVVKRQYIALSKIGGNNELEGFKIQILSKLCGTASERVCELMRQANGQQIVPQILEIIKDEVEVLELQELADSVNSDTVAEDTFEPTEGSSQSCYRELSHPRECFQPQRSQHQIGCIFCNRTDHISSMCQHYNSPYYYRQILFNSYLCYNCFESGHKSYACPHSKQCNVCNDNRKHSLVLCSRNSHYS